MAVIFIHSPQMKTGFARFIFLRDKSRSVKSSAWADICGWGTWIRTKIHSSKGWCAAIAPCPSAGKIVSQFYFSPGRRPIFFASSSEITSGLVDFLPIS
jgi:hypothetical protein